MVERTQPFIATWCPICDKRVSEKGKDTDRLLRHVRRHHRKIYDQRSVEEENIVRSVDRRFSNSTRITSLSPSTRKDRKRIYAARVDTWKSHDERKICPRCQREAVPALHTRRDGLTSSHVAAICLLGCWPFCFIPLMKRPKRVRMICPHCGFNYGMYEYKNNELTPCQEDDSEMTRKARLCDTTKVDCDRPRNDSKRSSWITARRFSNGLWPAGGTKKKRRSVFSTRVETWRYHDKSLLCPMCNEETRPIVFTKRHKFSSSRLGATCLLGCWPLCFVPLMLCKERQVRLVCPFCGHNYGNRVYEMKSTEGNEYEEESTANVEDVQPCRRDSDLVIRPWQEAWEVQDASQQTENPDGKTKKEVQVRKRGGGEDEAEEEEEEERKRKSKKGKRTRRKGASGPRVSIQNRTEETASRYSETCTLCSKQVTLDTRYEIQPELTDLDYHYDTDFEEVKPIFPQKHGISSIVPSTD